MCVQEGPGVHRYLRFKYYAVSDDGEVDVYKESDVGQLQQWVRVRDSLLMANHLQLRGKGLYAWQFFQADERLGKYSGKLVARAPEGDSCTVQAVSRLDVTQIWIASYHKTGNCALENTFVSWALSIASSVLQCKY